MKPTITGLLFPFSTAFCIDELMIFRLITATHTPIASPYGNSKFKPKNGREISSAIAAAMMVYRIVSFFNSEIALSSILRFVANSMPLVL